MIANKLQRERLLIHTVTVKLKLPLHETERFWKSNWVSDNKEQKAKAK